MAARKRAARPTDVAPSAPPVPEDAAGPWVSAMLLCERVLTEQDQVPSLIRVIDQVTIGVEALLRDGRQVRIHPAQLTDEQFRQIPSTKLTLQLMLRGGPPAGTHMILVVGEAPDGRRQVVAHVDRVRFEGTTGGFNTVLEIAAHLRHDGLYWFDVFCDNRLLARLPYQVYLDGVGQPAKEPASE